MFICSVIVLGPSISGETLIAVGNDNRSYLEKLLCQVVVVAGRCCGKTVGITRACLRVSGGRLWLIRKRDNAHLKRPS